MEKEATYLQELPSTFFLNSKPTPVSGEPSFHGPFCRVSAFQEPSLAYSGFSTGFSESGPVGRT